MNKLRKNLITIGILSCVLTVQPISVAYADNAVATSSSESKEDAAKKEAEEKAKKEAEEKAKKEKEEKDKAEAKTVSDTIAKLPATDQLTYEHEQEIANARSLYNALTDEQKALVGNEGTLAAAEKRIADMHAADSAASAAVREIIAQLPEVDAVMLDSETTIENARKAYNALTETQKGLIDNAEKLQGAEQRLQDLKEELTKPQVYTFIIPKDKTNTTIILRFTTDMDGDGKADQPEIYLIEPIKEETEDTSETAATSSESEGAESAQSEAEEEKTEGEATSEESTSEAEDVEEGDLTVEVAAGNAVYYPLIRPAVSYENLNTAFDLTWRDSYTQLDFSRIKEGEWKIYTSFPVLFSQTDYSGRRAIEEEAEEPAQEEANETETRSSTNRGTIILLSILGGAMAGLFLLWKFFLNLPKEKTDEEPIPRTEEDELQALREELAATEESYSEDEKEEEDEEEPEDESYISEDDIDNDETIEEIFDEDNREEMIQMVRDHMPKEKNS